MIQLLFLMMTTLEVTVYGSDLLNLLVIGDWGGKNEYPFYTEVQKRTAEGLGLVANEINAKAVISLGDNFYDYGVTEENVDIRYKMTFEDIYTHPSLVKIPWFVMAGNHDHFGDIKTQIALSQRYSRWHFPNTFYTHIWEWNELERIKIDGNETIVSRRHTIQLVVIDTAVFSGFVDNYDIPFKHPAGPPDEEMYRRGYDWLNSTLSESTADYLWVAGHYPLYTICLQGSNLHLLRDLQPLLNKYGAHYMAGHDHCQSHFVDDQTGVNYLVSGTGHGCCYSERTPLGIPHLRNRASEVETSAFLEAKGKMIFSVTSNNNPTRTPGGFASLRANRHHMRIVIHGQNGEILYESKGILPRDHAQGRQPSALGSNLWANNSVASNEVEA